MASKLSYKDENVSLECSICFSMFVHPKQLPCLHTFCLKCLNQYCLDKKAGDVKQCPLCRSEFSIPEGGVEKVKDNDIIGRLLQQKQFREVKKKVIHCELCLEVGENVESKTFCVDCGQNLCSRCGKVHSKQTFAKSHKVVDVGEKSIDEHLEKLKFNYCSKHTAKELELYCCDCNMLLCVLCQATEHSKHMCKYPVDVATEKRKKLTENRNLVENYSQELCEKSESHRLEKDKLMFQITEAKKSIEETCSKRRQLISDYESKLLDELEKIKTNSLKDMQCGEDIDDLRKTKINSFLSYSKMLMEKGTDCEIIKVADDMHKRASELFLIQNDEKGQKHSLVGVTFITSPEPTEADIKKLCGSISRENTPNIEKSATLSSISTNQAQILTQSQSSSFTVQPAAVGLSPLKASAPPPQASHVQTSSCYSDSVETNAKNSPKPNKSLQYATSKINDAKDSFAETRSSNKASGSQKQRNDPQPWFKTDDTSELDPGYQRYRKYTPKATSNTTNGGSAGANGASTSSRPPTRKPWIDRYCSRYDEITSDSIYVYATPTSSKIQTKESQNTELEKGPPQQQMKLVGQASEKNSKNSSELDFFD